MSRFFRPSHAYVPGVTARHPEGCFDSLKSGVTSGMTELQMQSSVAWQAGVDYRAEGYFWECHEVLEALWMVAPEGPLRNYVQAVIQMANAQLKEVMNRPKATLRLCGIVSLHLDNCDGRQVILGQCVEHLRCEVSELAGRIGALR